MSTVWEYNLDELDEAIEANVVLADEPFEVRRSYGCYPYHNCNSRTCDYCQWRLAANRARRLAPRIQGRTLWLITLVGIQTSSVKQGVKSTLRAFKKLSKWIAWRGSISGGIRNLHVVRSAIDDETYNPHLHCIVEADNLDLSKITEAWNKASGSLVPVHSQRLGDTYNDIVDSLTYVLNPAVRKIATTDLIEYSAGIKGSRKVCRFGSWYRLARAKQTQPTPQPINIHSASERFSVQADETPQPSKPIEPDALDLIILQWKNEGLLSSSSGYSDIASVFTGDILKAKCTHAGFQSSDTQPTEPTEPHADEIAERYRGILNNTQPTTKHLSLDIPCNELWEGIEETATEYMPVVSEDTTDCLTEDRQMNRVIREMRIAFFGSDTG